MLAAAYIYVWGGARSSAIGGLGLSDGIRFCLGHDVGEAPWQHRHVGLRHTAWAWGDTERRSTRQRGSWGTAVSARGDAGSSGLDNGPARWHAGVTDIVARSCQRIEEDKLAVTRKLTGPMREGLGRLEWFMVQSKVFSYLFSFLFSFFCFEFQI